MKKQNAFFAGAAVAGIALAGLVALGNSGDFIGKLSADGCQHVGNHYLASAANCEHAGNVEFWACCKCQTQYIEEPSVGDWTDQGAFTGVLEAGHIAYVAPEAHTWGTVKVNGTYTTAVKTGDDTKVELYKACDNCGHAMGEAIKEMDRKMSAQITVDTTSRTDPWTYDEETGWWTSKAGLSDSNGSSYVELRVTRGGILTFDYDVSSEAKYDCLHLELSGVYGDELLPTLPSGSGNDGISGTQTGRFSIDVETGETYILSYRKDGSGKSGRDNAKVKFIEEEISYSAVGYVSNGGSECEPSFVQDGKLVGSLPAPTKDGEYFEGWYTNPGLTIAYASQDLEPGALLYAKWSEPVTLTIDLNDGSTPTGTQYQIGTVPSITDPERTGYYFQGWFTDADCTIAYTGGAITANTTIYAKWLSEADVPALYGSFAGFYGYLSSGYYSTSLSYVSGYSDSFVVDASNNFTLRTSFSNKVTGTINSIDENGVVGFTCSDSKLASMTYDAASGTVLVKYNYSSSYSYFFILNRNGATSPTDKTYINSQKIGFFTTKINGVDTGVYFNPEESKMIVGVNLINENGEAQAFDSTIRDQMFFYVKKGGATIASFYYGGSSTFYTEGDGKEGVYTAANGKKVILSGKGKINLNEIENSSYAIGDYEVLSDGTIYAYYSSSSRLILTLNKAEKSFTYVDRTVTVTLDYGYKEEGEETNKTSDETWKYNLYTSIDTKPTRDGYDFDGWYTDPECTDKVTGTKALKADTTFYAKWTKVHMVTIVDGDTGVQIGEQIRVRNNETVVLPDEPTKDGALFEAWCTDPELTNVFDPTTPITAPTTIYVKFAAPLDVTLNYNNGSDPVHVEGQKGKTLEIANPTRGGYFFGGWFTDAELTQAWDATAPLTGDLTLYAKWSEQPFYVGSYKGGNVYGSYKNYNISIYSSYNSAFTADWNLGYERYAGSGKLSNCYYTGDASKDLDGNTFTFFTPSGTKYGYMFQAADGQNFLLTHYNGPSSDKLPNDMAFLAQTNGNIVLTQTTITTSIFAVQVNLDGAIYNVYVDAVNKLAMADVTFVTAEGDGFDKIYAGSTYTSSLTVKHGDDVVASFTGSGSSLSKAA